MKNKLIYALCALITVGFASCELTENPDSKYEKDTYFTTEEKARMEIGRAHV